MKFLDMIEVQGLKFAVWVDTQGRFEACLGTHQEDQQHGPHYWDSRTKVTADSLKQLKEKLVKQVKSQRVQVPLSMVEEPGWRYGGEAIKVQDILITGIHSGNGNLLWKKEGDNKSEQGSYRGSIVRRLTDEEKGKVMLLWNAKAAADDAYKAHLESLKVDPKALYTAALENKDKEKETE